MDKKMDSGFGSELTMSDPNSRSLSRGQFSWTEKSVDKAIP
jgi:hypothetical protein